MPQELQQAEAARRAKEAAHEAAEEERLLASCTVVDYKYMCVFMLGYAYVRSYTYIYIHTHTYIHTYIQIHICTQSNHVQFTASYTTTI